MRSWKEANWNTNSYGQSKFDFQVSFVGKVNETFHLGHKKVREKSCNIFYFHDKLRVFLEHVSSTMDLRLTENVQKARFSRSVRRKINRKTSPPTQTSTIWFIWVFLFWLFNIKENRMARYQKKYESHKFFLKNQKRSIFKIPSRKKTI